MRLQICFWQSIGPTENQIIFPASHGEETPAMLPRFAVGSRVRVWGRVQSREYTKKLSETQCEKRVAYEVSIRETEVIEDEN